MTGVLIEMAKLGNLNSGLGQFCLHLGAAIAAAGDERIRPVFHVPESQAGIFGNGFKYVSAGYLHRILPLSAGVNVWHSSHQDSPYVPQRNVRVVLTIHDLNFLYSQKPGWRKRWMLSSLQQRVNRASVVVAISEFVASEIRQHLHLKGKRLEVIHNGNCLNHHVNARRPRKLEPSRFLLAVGIISPKKNFHSLVQMLPGIDSQTHLVIAGADRHVYAREIRELAEKLGVQRRVHLTGPVSEEEKLWLYRNCEALLFPSLSEGFGLPVVEAMSCGKPVFLSRLTSLPEIGGDEAFYFDDFSPEAMSRSVMSGLSSFTPQHAERLRSRAARFTWRNAAEKYISLYKEFGRP